jgi:seryl-tRNA synthetase
MLDIKWIRENRDRVELGLKAKGASFDLEAFLKQEELRRSQLKEVEALKAELNLVSKEIGGLKKTGNNADSKIHEMGLVSAKIKTLDAELSSLEVSLQTQALRIPNMPHVSVPVGGEAENKEIRVWGQKPPYTFSPKTHWEIAEKWDIVDFKRGAKLSGSGFLLFKKEGAQLERALINYFIDTHVQKHGFVEVSTPFLVNRKAMIGTGQLPIFEEDMYALKDEDLFLIPTAEVPVTNIFQDETLDEKILPLKYTAYSPCFRREAGAYGKDTRGMIRIHQFDKVEMVAWVKPEESYSMLETLVSHAEYLLQSLEIPYRVLCLASRDMSFASSKTYDLEVWAPGIGRYLEVSSVSNFEDFQARRAGIKARQPSGKSHFLHTLNGSGLALPRCMIALMENHQNADGSFNIPKVLQPYLNGRTTIGS